MAGAGLQNATGAVHPPAESVEEPSLGNRAHLEDRTKDTEVGESARKCQPAHSTVKPPSMKSHRDSPRRTLTNNLEVKNRTVEKKNSVDGLEDKVKKSRKLTIRNRENRKEKKK